MFQEIIKQYIKKGDRVIDIGASYGGSSIELAKAVGSEGKVYAFEPNPDAFHRLSGRIKKYKWIKPINRAVSDSTGLRMIYSYPEKNDTRYTHIYKAPFSRELKEIEFTSLDDYFKDYDGKINFIKIDIQGGEGLVLNGMLKFLEKQKSIVIMTAFWNQGMHFCGNEGKVFLMLLMDMGFVLTEHNKRTRKLFDINKDTVDKFLKQYPTEGKRRGNLTHILCERK